MLQFLVFLQFRGISCINFCKYESLHLRHGHDEAHFNDSSDVPFQLECTAEYAPYQRPSSILLFLEVMLSSLLVLKAQMSALKNCTKESPSVPI